MLRLRPSELTLTPDDVDETFRRIALRQTSRERQHWTMPPAGQPGQSGRPNRPVLRRGPQRLVRHAMTINDIPILQPQQAAITSVDEGNDNNDESRHEAAQPPVRANSRLGLPHLTHQRNGATVGFPLTLASHPIQLPLRLRSDVQAPNVQTMSNEQSEGSTSPAPQSHHLPRRERSASARNVENGNEQRAQLPSVDSAANTLGLRGGGLASVARPHNVTQDTIFAPAPLNYVQRLSSRSGGGLVSLARASNVAQDTLHAPSPLDQAQRLTLATQQASPRDPTKPQSSASTDYATPYLNKCSAEAAHNTHCICRNHEYTPSSEPRRGSDRHAATTRSRSSGDAASSSSGMCPSTFSSALKGLGQCDQTSLKRRERGSGATSASAAYSWYGSLGSDSQFPGSETSQHDESCPQPDGARANAHRLSPLPSLPYTRIQNDHMTSSPSCPHSRQLSRDHVMATIAVRQDFQSPLDAPVEQYQRCQQTPLASLNFPTHANPTTSSVGGLPVDGPNRNVDMPSEHPACLGPGSGHGAFRQQSSPGDGTFSLGSFSRTSEHPRLEQRSSENDTSSAPVHQGDAGRRGRVQMQRAVYERIQNSAYTMHSGPAGGIDVVPSHGIAVRRNPPYETSSRPRNHMAHDGEGFDAGSSVGMHLPRQPSPGQTQRAVHVDPLRRLPSLFSRQHSAEFSRNNTNPRVDGGGPSRARVQSPLIRGAPTTMARTHRRVRGEQRDQENGGEEQLMRRDEASVMARYGEAEQQRTTMNETPPRIGRVERRMME